jgi:predicted Zn-dependent peptidase
MALVQKAGRMALAAAPTRRGTIARLAFAVPAGPVYEDAWSAGTSHLLRRMAYRDNFIASGWRTEFDLSNAGLNTDAGYQAGLVGRQFIVYSVSGPADTVLQTSVVDKLAQMVFFPRFHPRDVEITNQYLKYDQKKLKVGHPADYVKEYLFQIAFKGSPHGNPLFVPEYNLKWAGTEQLWNLWEKNYRHDTIKIVGSNVDLDKLGHIIEGSQWLADVYEKKDANPLTKTPLKSKYYGGHYQVIHRRDVDFDPEFINTADTWTGVAFEAPAFNNRKQYLAGWIAKGALDQTFGKIAFTGNASKAKTFYEPMDGAGLIGAVFTNYEGVGDAPEKRGESIKQALQSVADNAEKFEAAKKSAILQVSARLNCSHDAVDDTIMSLWTRDEAPTVDEVLAELKSFDQGAFKEAVKKIVESKATTVFYGGKPLSSGTSVQ